MLTPDSEFRSVLRLQYHCCFRCPVRRPLPNVAADVKAAVHDDVDLPRAAASLIDANLHTKRGIPVALSLRVPTCVHISSLYKLYSSGSLRESFRPWSSSTLRLGLEGAELQYGAAATATAAQLQYTHNHCQRLLIARHSPLDSTKPEAPTRGPAARAHDCAIITTPGSSRHGSCAPELLIAAHQHISRASLAAFNQHGLLRRARTSATGSTSTHGCSRSRRR